MATHLHNQFPHLSYDICQRISKTCNDNFFESRRNAVKQDEVDFLSQLSFDLPTSADEVLCSYKEVTGDLFESKDSGIAHCVSQDLHMGKGIAVAFKKKFGGVDQLKEQHPKIGNLVYLSQDSCIPFYMITKEKYWHKPSYSNVFSSLQELRKKAEELNIATLSMPEIACGLDMLNWNVVRSLIWLAFSSSKVCVTVYHYNSTSGKNKRKRNR